MIEPRLIGSPTIFRLNLVFRKCVEQPHTLIGVTEGAEPDGEQAKKKHSTFGHDDSGREDFARVSHGMCPDAQTRTGKETLNYKLPDRRQAMT